MKILFFDTETTGFPKNWWELIDQPNIIQLAGMFCEDEKVIQSFDFFFQTHHSISPDLTKLHWITNEMIDNYELLYHSDFLKKFIKMMNDTDIICGHNVDFDFKMIFIEIERLIEGFPEKTKPFEELKKTWKEKSICTMQYSTDLCKIPGSYWKYKWPKLQELHTFLFNEWFDKAHNALNDIEATKRCFFELNKMGIFWKKTKELLL